MPWIFQYFWFICAGFMLINILVWRQRLAGAVERGILTKTEMAQFIRWASGILVGGSILLGVIGAIAGWSSPFCAGIMLFTDVPRTLVSLITLSGWLGLLWWVWRGNGADFLSRVAPALSQRPAHDTWHSPRLVRLAVTAMVVFGSVGTVVTWRMMPLPPQMGCQVTAGAGQAGDLRASTSRAADPSIEGDWRARPSVDILPVVSVQLEVFRWS
jgi:hypothetical protein